MKVLQNLLQKIRRFVTDMWTRTSNRDRLRYLVIAIIAVVLIVGSLVMLNTSRYTPLADVTPAGLTNATVTLNQASIPFRMGNNGTTIMVDKENLSAAVAALAQANADVSEIDYTVYSNATGITATTADKEFFKKAQDEAWLRNALRQFDGVSDALVLLHIVDNKNSIYQSEFTESTASVTVFFNEGAAKNQAVISSIADFVGNATGVKPENITIMDETMQNLNQERTDYSTVQEHTEMRKLYEKDLANAITRLLTPSLGEDYFTVAASAVLDFDIHTTDKVTFEPVVDDEGIPRSLQTIEEHAKGSYPTGENPATDVNGAGDTYTDLEGEYSTYDQISNTINYEINQINEHIEAAPGKLTELTISLTVDQERLEDNAQNRVLLQSAVGGAVGLLQAEWENRIQVNFMDFVGRKELDDAQTAFNDAQQRDSLFSFLQVILLYVVIGVCVLLLVWRTLSLFKPQTVDVPEEGDYLVGDLAEYGDLVDAAVQSMELEVNKTPSRERVEEFIDNNPEAVANMLRNWLADEGEKSW